MDLAPGWPWAFPAGLMGFEAPNCRRHRVKRCNGNNFVTRTYKVGRFTRAIRRQAAIGKGYSCASQLFLIARPHASEARFRCARQYVQAARSVVGLSRPRGMRYFVQSCLLNGSAEFSVQGDNGQQVCRRQALHSNNPDIFLSVFHSAS